ncbi:hypothetical protein B4U80_08090 [Leptotrombidium deliense]|uniref:Uncharacterized protein n=1 Tax=Leptotrombidium deliense TaxID=299467 RepID=A0A443RTT6_9ACAR|nr:hypothetical protein B4U80_08090 [Leptotrombidium deliense]
MAFNNILVCSSYRKGEYFIKNITQYTEVVGSTGRQYAIIDCSKIVFWFIVKSNLYSFENCLPYMPYLHLMHLHISR